jgi:hypothetical protein
MPKPVRGAENAEIRCRIGAKSGAAFRRNHPPLSTEIRCRFAPIFALDGDGKRVWRGKCHSHPDDIEAVLRQRAPQAERIGLETGPLTTWLWTELTGHGLPMVCLDARHAKRALDMRPNKHRLGP